MPTALPASWSPKPVSLSCPKGTSSKRSSEHGAVHGTTDHGPRTTDTEPPLDLVLRGTGGASAAGGLLPLPPPMPAPPHPPKPSDPTPHVPTHIPTPSPP